MNSIKLLLALALALIFTGCEVTVVDEYSSYEDRHYKTSYYSYTMDCDLMYPSGYVDVNDVLLNTCSNWYGLDTDIAFDFSPNNVVERYGNRVTTYYVEYVDAFSYGGDIYITYDIGKGLVFEYNYSQDEVGEYDDGVVYYYSN
ncbi:MAG TPA: hypothetical protein PK366_03080 [Fibrobacteraceae bacterium]|nr:hypothetical protein [Fibrobacteraceae bacterium]